MVAAAQYRAVTYSSNGEDVDGDSVDEGLVLPGGRAFGLLLMKTKAEKC